MKTKKIKYLIPDGLGGNSVGILEIAEHIFSMFNLREASELNFGAYDNEFASYLSKLSVIYVAGFNDGYVACAEKHDITL